MADWRGKGLERFRELEHEISRTIAMVPDERQLAERFAGHICAVGDDKLISDDVKS